MDIQKSRLVILGAGGFGRTVADIASQLNIYSNICHLDDADGENVIGKLADLPSFIDDVTEFIVAFGNNSFRLEWCDEIARRGGKLATIVHPTAYVSPTAKIDEGTIVLPKAIINTNTRIGRGAIINCGAIIDHDCVIGNCCHICLGAIVKGENIIPQCTKIEAGQVVPNKHFHN